MPRRNSAVVVRAADPADANAISRILRASFDPSLLPYTIYASGKVVHFLRDTIRLNAVGGAVSITVATREQQVIGFCELRRDANSLFLNHIHVLPSERAGGVGRRLLGTSIPMARNCTQSQLMLDVSESNVRAYEWYRSLGLSLDAVSSWTLCDLPAPAATDSACAYADQLPSAELSFQRYGFCQFQVTSPTGEYTVGRIGGDLYRVTDGGLTADPSAMRLLAALEPGRRLLCISRDTPSEPRALNRRVVGRSHRLSGDIDSGLDALSEP